MDRFAGLVENLAKSVRQKGDREFCAPGPREAWAWLLIQDSLGAATHKGARSRAIYRGQANSEWGLEPTSLRLAKEELGRAKVATKHFSDIAQTEFGMLFESDNLVSWPPLHPRSGEAAAQHFGMPTSLLDWSANYSVALHFATRQATGHRSSTVRELVTVWWVYLSDLEDLNLNIILAPPYVERLYLQRGLFLDTANQEQVEGLESRSYRIDFPATYHQRVPILLEGSVYEAKTLEPPHPWFEALYEYCMSDHGAQVASNLQDPVPRSIAFAGHLSELGCKTTTPWPDYIAEDYGLATWLGEDRMLRRIPEFILALGQRTSAKGKVGLDQHVLQLLERDNAGLIEWALPLLNAITEERRSCS